MENGKIMVTGGAGFIGSHIVQALNARGDKHVLVVDDPFLSKQRLHKVHSADYMSVGEMRERLRERKGQLPKLKAIIHQGACTDTMNTDREFMMDMNLHCSKELLAYALIHRIPFIYASSASVYGNRGREYDPLNVYAESKAEFDRHVQLILPRAESPVVGLRYFNVYGPNERHKGRMASMVTQLSEQLIISGYMRIFEPGDQRRDFVHVSDVVRVNLFFIDREAPSGIYDVGTGESVSFNELCQALVTTLGRGRIEYIPFPDFLKGKYQDNTKANIAPLREVGYMDRFLKLRGGTHSTQWGT